MWRGKITEKLKKLHEEYFKKFDCEPDEYAEIVYCAMTYDEYIGYIKQCIEENKEMPDIVE